MSLYIEKPWTGTPCVESVFSLSRPVLIVASAMHFILFIIYLVVSLVSAGADFVLDVTWTQYEFSSRTYKTSVIISDVPGFMYPGIFLLLSSLEHFFQAYWHTGFLTGISQRRNPLKWFFYSLSAPWMATGIAHISGISEFSGLFSIWILTATTMYFGYAIEAAKFRDSFVLFLLGCVPTLAAWILIFCALGLTTDTVPDFVYGLVIVMFIMFNTFTASMLMLLCDVYKPAENGLRNSADVDLDAVAYARYTVIDVWLSFIAKFILPLIVFASTVRSI